MHGNQKVPYSLPQRGVGIRTGAYSIRTRSKGTDSTTGFIVRGLIRFRFSELKSRTRTKKLKLIDTKLDRSKTESFLRKSQNIIGFERIGESIIQNGP